MHNEQARNGLFGLDSRSFKILFLSECGGDNKIEGQFGDWESSQK